MEHFFELTKYVVPSLVVFATVYYMMKQYLTAQYNMSHLEHVKNNAANMIPIKLQAYERLMLLCERIRISRSVQRLNSQNFSVEDLRNSLLISVEKEFEHNLAQKLYVSDKLWEIIKTAKDQVLSEISLTSELFNNSDPSDHYADKLILNENSRPRDAVDVAISALKEEAKILLSN